MKFLIDECLHTSLVKVANDAGYEAHHVVHLGLQGIRDEILMRRIREDEFTFVTNNAFDFERLFSAEPLHAGLIIFTKNVPPTVQRDLFKAVLSEIEAEPINSVIALDWDGSNAFLEIYPWSAEE